MTLLITLFIVYIASQYLRIKVESKIKKEIHGVMFPTLFYQLGISFSSIAFFVGIFSLIGETEKIGFALVLIAFGLLGLMYIIFKEFQKVKEMKFLKLMLLHITFLNIGWIVVAVAIYPLITK